MPISKKPVKKHIHEKTIDQIINRGGSVALSDEVSNDVLSEEITNPSFFPEHDKKRKGVLVKFYEETLDDMKKIISLRKTKITRQGWIEETIQKRIDEELSKITSR